MASEWQSNYDQYKPSEGVISEEQRPWDFLDIVSAHLNPEDRVLDAGCGTGKKLRELMATKPLYIAGFDINSKLLHTAKSASLAPRRDIDYLFADSQHTFPFPDTKFSAVTFMLSKHNAAEAFRVLRPRGIVIIERVGDKDKLDIKKMFGKDQNGEPRGYNMSEEIDDLTQKYKLDFVNAGFGQIQCRSGMWRSFHSPEGLQYLLEHTPFVKNYDHFKDLSTFNEVIQRYSTSNGIQITQHRILIIAIKI